MPTTLFIPVNTLFNGRKTPIIHAVRSFIVKLKKKVETKKHETMKQGNRNEGGGDRTRGWGGEVYSNNMLLRLSKGRWRNKAALYLISAHTFHLCNWWWKRVSFCSKCFCVFNLSYLSYLWWGVISFVWNVSQFCKFCFRQFGNFCNSRMWVVSFLSTPIISGSTTRSKGWTDFISVFPLLTGSKW